MREIGIVKWFNFEKGFGFISRINEHEDLFVHVTQLSSKGTSINEGSFVTYIISDEKKREAIQVKLLRDEEDYKVLENAFLSRRNGIWQHGFKKFLPKVQEPDESLINEVIEKLDSYRNRSSLVEFIPKHFFLFTSKLDKYLTTPKKIKLVVMKISNSSFKHGESSSDINDLIELLKDDDNRKNWSLIPDLLLSKSPLLIQIAPKERVFNYFISLLEETETTSISDDFLVFLKNNAEFLKDLPDDIINKNEQLIGLLSPRKQIEVTWSEIDRKWGFLSIEAKFLAVYKSAKENDKVNSILSKLKGQRETNLLVRACIFILSTKLYSDQYLERGIPPFKTAHNMIQEYFIKTNNFENKLSNIFPICTHQVTSLCEGRKWFDADGEGYVKNSLGLEQAFCPRKAGPCEIGDHGARVYSNTNKRWEEWTLAELIDFCEMEINLPELNRIDVYILKLNGWLNRLIEIRDRMKCSKCNETLVADFKYAKNLAVYNSTVCECRNCNEKVYLTHCWACHNVIDSRESCFQIDGIYMCIHCGSGPKKSETFSQGDFCPRCNSLDMDDDAYRSKICNNCNHKIKLPLEKYLTGISREKKFHPF